MEGRGRRVNKGDTTGRKGGGGEIFNQTIIERYSKGLRVGFRISLILDWIHQLIQACRKWKAE